MSVTWSRGRPRRTSKLIGVFVAVSALVMTGGLAYASDVNESIVDTSAPTGAVALAPGVTGDLTLNLTVTGNQAGTATFQVYQDWNLSGGAFQGSNPTTFTVAPQSGGETQRFQTTGTLTVANGQADGTFTLAAGAFGITNSNTTGGKLGAGTSSNYAVTVKTPPSPTNTKPTVSVTGITDGAIYELGYDTLPTAQCSVTDAEDGPSTFDAVMTGSLDHGVGTRTATCNYTDQGGLAANTAIASYTIVDTHEPTISHTLSAEPNGNGWFKDDVTVTFNCADDPGSGIQSCLADGESGNDKILSEGANQSVGGTATDWAGNTATDTASEINVDKTAPSVNLVDGPADGATYYYGFVPAAPTCNASDGLSGLDGECTVSGYSDAIGTHALKASATDKAGNTGNSTVVTYTVEHWSTRGFFSPVNMGSTGSTVWNTVKGGSTVPLKFELFAGSTELTDTNLITGFAVKKVACDTSAPTDDIEFTTTGGTSLRYDTTAGQFVQNWKTPTGSGCYVATMTANDGSTIAASFKTR